MEVEVLKKGKTELKIQVNENNQGILNTIKSELWQDNATQIAGFHIEHPEKGKPVFTIKTKNKEATKVWNDAIDKLNKQVDKLKTSFKSF